MKNTETIENILRLRQLQDVVQSRVNGADFQQLEKTIISLQDSFGELVRKSQAAELLGISRQTLERWIKEGVVPVVSSARGKTEIPRQALENLLLDVRELRSKGNGDFLLRQLRCLQKEAPFSPATKSASGASKKTASKSKTSGGIAKASGDEATKTPASRKTKSSKGQASVSKTKVSKSKPASSKKS